MKQDMVSPEKVAAIPAEPGVYQFLNAAGEVIYVGKAKSLRHRVRSYFLQDKLEEPKTSSLLDDAADVHYILVDNEKEALALENNLIKQIKPRYNILLRDDKTYPYIKLTNEKHPRVYVTRRLLKDRATYYGPYFPASLAYRLVNFIHRCFGVSSCSVDLGRKHPRPCLEYHIHRCLGVCAGLVSDEVWAQAARDVRLFLEGRHGDLVKSLRERMAQAAEREEFEQAAACRDLITTVEDLNQRQKVAAAAGDDIDIFGFYREGALAAVELFHLRNGRIVDRRSFFWEDLPAEDDAFDAPQFFSTLLPQIYLDQAFIPSAIHVPADFEDRELLEEMLSERKKRKVEIHTPQRGPKRALLELVEKNAKHSFEQRFRVLKPSSKAISEALEEALGLPEPPRRIECFDISHVQGSDTVASMVAWEDGRMKKGDYRKFIIRTVEGSDDFASMREVVGRRYRRLMEERKPMPGLVLIDGGLGQLHAAAQALEEVGAANQPLASIAKKEEIIYVLGRGSEPIVLERHSPILHLVQMARDEAHRFAVSFHRQRRQARHLATELLLIPGVGQRTAQKLLREFGSIGALKDVTEERLAQVAGRAQAARIYAHFHNQQAVSGRH
jgi:excinuclease ABC subunit C